MSSKFSIDINCDVGEGIGNESQLMPYISSCNIACNEHAGSIEIIDEVIALAKEQNVKVGAHPSFPDRENFGRKVMQITDEDLQTSIENQIILLIERAALQDVKLYHIKPHGALYNLIAKDIKTAKVIVEAVQNTIPDAFLYVPFNSVIEEVALQNNIKIKYEAFADRNYNDDLSLVARSNKNALLTNPKEVVSHIINMINGKVKTIQGNLKNIKTDTFCVHGDTENAIEILKTINHHFG